MTFVILRDFENLNRPTPLFVGVVNPTVPLVCSKKLVVAQYKRFKNRLKNWYLCVVKEFGRLEGIYLPIFKGCEYNVVIKSPNIWYYAKVMVDLTLELTFLKGVEL